MEEVHVVGAAILNGNTCLVAQRGEQMSVPLKWEFPGGKVKAGEAPADALRREISEEFGVAIEVYEFLGEGSSEIRGHAIRLEVFRAQILSGDLIPIEHHQIRWVNAEKLVRLDWAEADIPVVPVVQDLLTRQDPSPRTFSPLTPPDTSPR